MKAASSSGMWATFRTLWLRAPLWRLAVMSALLLTMLFVLYPPQPLDGKQKPANTVKNTADYLSQKTVLPVLPLPKTPVVAAKNQAGPATPVTGSAVAAHSKPAVDVAAAAAMPKTASVSMVTTDAKSDGSSGINNATMGRLYSGSIQIDGFKLPLPPGNWVRLAAIGIKVPTATGNGFFFGKIENKRLVAALSGYVLKSKDNPGAGFNEAKSCTKADPTRNFVSIEEVIPFDNEACWLIHSYFTPPWQQWADRSINISVIDRAAAGDLTAKGVTYPQDLVDVHFIRFAKWGGMEVHYLFSPEAEGISSNTVMSYADMDWRGNNIGRYPEKVAYVDKLKAWGEMFWPKFKAGFAEAEPAADLK
ncbi:hypothetical protein [Collimonas humicola]|uniref:hypothetical protein n=1 Tax=Collimonas humicola TaxID=2825886 RepID=UPI001B8BBB8C|nr:hypothetical protein [Collimonas humicola]